MDYLTDEEVDTLVERVSKTTHNKGKRYGKKYIILADNQGFECGTLPKLKKELGFCMVKDFSKVRVYLNMNNQIAIDLERA